MLPLETGVSTVSASSYVLERAQGAGMPWKEPDCWKPVGHTCPAIDKMKTLARKHVMDDAARKALLDLLEELRQENAQLRYNENHWRKCAVW